MKNNKTNVNKDIIKNIEELSRLNVDETEANYFKDQFNETLEVIDELNNVDTKKTPPTNQVTGLINVFRDDVIDKKRMLSQEEALSQSGSTYNGYFVVKAIFYEK